MSKKIIAEEKPLQPFYMTFCTLVYANDEDDAYHKLQDNIKNNCFDTSVAWEWVCEEVERTPKTEFLFRQKQG
jgi:hypothetical protein